MMQTEDSSRTIKLERVDLDFRSKPEAVERLEGFLLENRTDLALEGEHDLVAVWLERVWPEGVSGDAIITKLAPKDGKHSWQLRPPWADARAPETRPVAAGSQVPSFGVRYWDGKLEVRWFEQVLHRPLGLYDYQLQGQFFLKGWRGGMTEADAGQLLALPHYAPSAESRFAEWQKYLDWREKVTVDNSKHRYAYAEWE